VVGFHLLLLSASVFERRMKNKNQKTFPHLFHYLLRVGWESFALLTEIFRVSFPCSLSHLIPTLERISFSLFNGLKKARPFGPGTWKVLKFHHVRFRTILFLATRIHF
jgi:hypothetical protein